MKTITSVLRPKFTIHSLFLLIFISSCTRKVEIPVMDYTLANTVKLPEWECHQTFLRCHDSINNTWFLEVTAFPEKQYPGIATPFLTGDWSHYTFVKITARMRNSPPIPFTLSIWDGIGEYVKSNRVTKQFILDTTWTECIVPLSQVFFTPNHRKMNIKNISKVVFFTGKKPDPVIFDIAKIELK